MHVVQADGEEEIRYIKKEKSVMNHDGHWPITLCNRKKRTRRVR